MIPPPAAFYVPFLATFVAMLLTADDGPREALAAFHRAHPGVEIALLEENSDRLVQGVRAGTVETTETTRATAGLPGPGGLCSRMRTPSSPGTGSTRRR
ncbi:hypothetical protein ACFCV9_18895 [Streptomyces sp. NPDC056367]|uniref:hypothetical protein n=1 Tax=Streptomyces sp. NPDC056367 TaxID=3345797 RepID=UPI0035DA9715